MHTIGACGKSVLAGVVALGLPLSLGPAHAGLAVLYAFTEMGRDGAYPMAGLIQDERGNLYGTTYEDAYYGRGTVFKLAPDDKETVLHSFSGQNNDGVFPYAGLIEDEAGNLYGTTSEGGKYGFGTVFKVAPDGKETLLYSFAGGSDSANPRASVIEDKAGDFYGTTADGFYAYGTVFKLAPDGTKTVLHSFGYKDGAYPYAGVIIDEAGNLYGTASWGGIGCQYGEDKGEMLVGCGTVFKLAPDGMLTVLHAFRGRNHGDGAHPYAGLIRDKAGNLYGTTNDGGTHGKGTVFKLAPDDKETVLYDFAGGSDGAYPEAGLIRDKAGNLYGTTVGGGGGGNRGSACWYYRGCGTVFRLAPDGTETILYAFGKHMRRGGLPYATLMKGSDGRLYGTAFNGGGGPRCNFGCGTVFRVSK